MISEKINRDNAKEEKNMKKRKIIKITVLTVLLLTLSFASAGTMAGAKTKNGFTYKITKNQVKIVSCSKNQKRIVIPNKIAGKKVTSLGANVWKKSSKVQTIVLPKYLKTIEKKQADYGWGNIAKKKNVFSTPFTGCSKLKNIKVAKGNKYFCSAKGVLYTKNKKTLLIYPAGRTQKSYTIQGKTTQIGEAAFEYAKYLQKISYGKKLFYISDGAFFASGLRSVELAKNISNVGLYAFAYSTKLQKVTLGDKVEQINTPFIGCTNLKQFQADKKETGYYAVNDVLYYKDKEKTYARWVQYVNEYEEGATLYDGFEDVFKAFDGKIIQAVVSAKTTKQYQIDFVDKGLDQYMQVAILADDTDKHKPDPEPLFECLKRINVKPSEAIYIGDALSDYLASQNAHMDFGYAKWGSVSSKGIDEPTYIFETPLELLKLL